MPDIVVTEFMDEAAVADLSATHDVVYDPKLVDRAEDLVRLLADARGLIVRNRTQVRGVLLEAAPRLKAVGRLGVGLDNIDVAACEARGIAVLPATGANDDSVAEYVIAGLLMLRRSAYFASAEVAAGGWPRNRLMGREALGATLGVVVFGAIERAVAIRARALGMRIVASDPFVPADSPHWAAFGATKVDLDRLVADSDVISLHVPLTAETRGLFGADRLAAMRPGSVLINAARGGVVDEAALAASLRAGHLGGAMLDVFDAEPLPGGGPLVDVPNLILTPHVAGVTVESNERVSAVTVANVRRILGSRP
ncbi:MAG: hydroxyacid dehydrogenase [Rhodospirillales bacterium]